MSNAGFEGFDYDSNYHLTEKEERNENWAQAKIWVVLGLFMALCLGLTIYMNSKELLLKFNGNSVVTEYKNGDGYANVVDDNGTKHVIDLTATIIANQNGKITLYYWGNNIAGAKAMTAFWFWAMMYSIWTPLSALCVYFTYKNVNQNKNKKIKAKK